MLENIPNTINQEFYNSQTFKDFIQKSWYSKKLQDFILNSWKIDISFEEKKEIFYEFDSSFDYSKIPTINIINAIKLVYNLWWINHSELEIFQENTIDIIRKYINELFRESFLKDFKNKLISVNKDIKDKIKAILK